MPLTTHQGAQLPGAEPHRLGEPVHPDPSRRALHLAPGVSHLRPPLRRRVPVGGRQHLLHGSGQVPKVPAISQPLQQLRSRGPDDVLCVDARPCQLGRGEPQQPGRRQRVQGQLHTTLPSLHPHGSGLVVQTCKARGQDRCRGVRPRLGTVRDAPVQQDGLAHSNDQRQPAGRHAPVPPGHRFEAVVGDGGNDPDLLHTRPAQPRER